MSKAAWILVIAAVASVSANLCADVRPPHITVMLRNDAEAPPGMVAAAQRSVSEVYEAAGVDIAWGGPRPAAMLALVSRERARAIGHRPEVIGFATGNRGRRGKVAYIFLHRVKELSARYRLPESVILGAAIAHELGHLLLPHDSHSDVGVMRPILDHAEFRKADRGELLFTANQAVQIREAIAGDASFRR